MVAGVMEQARSRRGDVATATSGDFQVPAEGGSRDLETQMVGQYLRGLPDALVRCLGKAAGGEHLLDQIPRRQSFGSRRQGTTSVVDVPKAADTRAAHGLGQRLDDLGPQERRVGVAERQRGTTALDDLIARAVVRGDPIPTRLQRHWLQKATRASYELGEGKVEAQVVRRVLVERHVPEGSRDVEAEHPVVRLEELVQVLYLLVATRKLFGKRVDPAIVVDYALLA